MTARAVALGQVVQAVESGVDENAFGALLRRYRVAAELSQEALAERAHMSARGISDLERGVRSKPYRGTVDQLAAALGLNAAEREALEHTARRVRDVLPERHDAVVPSEALLTTKLTIPPARSRLVARPHLLRRLGEGSRGPLTLLAAPAGSGKTTLLTAWLEDALREDRPVAWVALDERDNDPVRFSLYVAAALDKAGMTISPESRRLLQPPQPAPIEVVFTRVLNDLSVRLDDLILMLDDYHVIENEVIHQGVAFLLEHLPPQLHLVLSTRIDPPLPLARVRAGGQITEVRIADLRFSRDEVGEFLAEIMGLALPSEEIAALERRTEGWIAGLQLAALSLQGRSQNEVAAFVSDFTGSHRHVIDYLTDEVLAGLPESVQHFLLHTSILDRLSVSLCALVMDRETSEEVLVRHQALLEELERNNLFVEALDDRREWYRYHHLFAEALRHRLQQSLPGCLEEAHLRASDWFEDHGFVLEAIEHALAAAAFERSADLIERLELMLFQQSANETLRRLLIRVPEPILVRHPTLCVTRAWFLLDEGHRDEGERWLDVAEGALQAGQGRKDAQDVQGEIAAARAYAASFRGDAAEVASLTDAALRDLRRNSLLARGLAHLALARGFMAQGEFDRAARSYADAAAIGRRTGNAQAVMRAAFGQSQMERAQGQLRRAMETCRQTIAWSAERGHPYPGVGMMHLALADLHRERNELDRALRLAAEGVDLCRRVEAEPDARVYPRFVLARIEQACGRLDAALDVVHNVQALVETSEPARSRSGWQAFEAQLWLRKGDLAAAVACAERAAREKIQDDLTLPAIAFLRGRENTLLVPIQILIAQGSVGRSPEHLHEALSLLDERRRSADKNRAVWVQIKTRVLEALAHHSLGETAQARASLEEALALGEPEWYVRVIADEGKPVADLLCEIPVTGVSSDYVAALLSAIHPTH